MIAFWEPPTSTAIWVTYPVPVADVSIPRLTPEELERERRVKGFRIPPINPAKRVASGRKRRKSK